MFHSIAFFLWESTMFFNTPKNYGGILWQDAASLLKETHLLPNDMVPLQAGNIPVPYVACYFQFTAAFLICRIHVKQCNTQCTKAIFIPWKSCNAKMTMLRAHSSFPMGLHSILVKKPCSCKKKNLTHGIFLLKRLSLPCLLFLKTHSPFGWGKISFIQYERLVLSS